MIVLGVDPSTVATGWGILDGDSRKARAVEYDVIRPSSRLPSGVQRVLLDPLVGFAYSVSSEDALRLERGHRALTELGDAELALSTAQGLLARDPHLFASPLFIPYIDLTGRVFTDQDSSQTRRYTAFFDKVGDFDLDFPAYFLSYAFSIK